MAKKTLNPTNRPVRFDVDSQGLRANWAQIRHFFDDRHISSNDPARITRDQAVYLFYILNELGILEANNNNNVEEFKTNVDDASRIRDRAASYGYWNNDSENAVWPSVSASLNDIVTITPATDSRDEDTITINPGWDLQFLRELLDTRTRSSYDVAFKGVADVDGPALRVENVPQNMILLDDSDGTTRITAMPLVLKAHFDRFMRQDPIERNKLVNRVVDAFADDSEIVYRMQRLLSESIENHRQTGNWFWDRITRVLVYRADSEEVTSYGYPRVDSDSSPEAVIDWENRQRLGQIVIDSFEYDSDRLSNSAVGSNDMLRRMWGLLLDNWRYDQDNAERRFQELFYNYFDGYNTDLHGEQIDSDVLDTRIDLFTETLTDMLSNRPTADTNADRVQRYHEFNRRFVEGIIGTYVYRQDDSENGQTGNDQRGWLTRRLADAISSEKDLPDSDHVYFIDRVFYDYLDKDSDNRFTRLINETLDEMTNDDSDLDNFMQRTLFRWLDSEVEDFYGHRDQFVREGVLRWADSEHDPDFHDHRDDFVRHFVMKWLEDGDVDHIQHRRDLIANSLIPWLQDSDTDPEFRDNREQLITELLFNWLDDREEEQQDGNRDRFIRTTLLRWLGIGNDVIGTDSEQDPMYRVNRNELIQKLVFGWTSETDDDDWEEHRQQLWDTVVQNISDSEGNPLYLENRRDFFQDLVYDYMWKSLDNGDDDRENELDPNWQQNRNQFVNRVLVDWMRDSERDMEHVAHRRQFVFHSLVKFLYEGEVDGDNGSLLADHILNETGVNFVDRSTYDPRESQADFNRQIIWDPLWAHVSTDSEDILSVWRDLLDRIDPSDSDLDLTPLYDHATNQRLTRIISQSLAGDSEANILVAMNVFNSITQDSDIRQQFSTNVLIANNYTTENRVTNLRSIIQSISGGPDTGEDRPVSHYDDTVPNVDADGEYIPGAWEDSDGYIWKYRYGTGPEWMYGDVIVRDSDGDIGEVRQFAEDDSELDPARHLFWEMIGTLGDGDRYQDSDNQSTPLSDLTDSIINQITNSRADQYALTRALFQDGVRQIMQEALIGVADSDGARPFGVVRPDPLTEIFDVTFNVPDDFHAPAVDDVRVYLNGILMSVSSSWSRNGRFSAPFDPDVNISVADRDIIVSFDDPLLDDYVVTIEYNTTRRKN